MPAVRLQRNAARARRSVEPRQTRTRSAFRGFASLNIEQKLRAPIDESWLVGMLPDVRSQPIFGVPFYEAVGKPQLERWKSAGGLQPPAATRPPPRATRHPGDRAPDLPHSRCISLREWKIRSALGWLARPVEITLTHADELGEYRGRGHGGAAPRRGAGSRLRASCRAPRGHRGARPAPCRGAQ